MPENWIKNLLSGGYKGRPLVETSEEVRDYYSEETEAWQRIYNGEPEWRYVSGGANRGVRRISQISAAKSLCRELAALCFSQQVDINIKDKTVEEYVEKVLQENRFWENFPLLLEQMFAVGSGVVKVYSEEKKVKLDYVGGGAFVPTEYDNKGIVSGAIISSRAVGNIKYIMVEEHHRTNKGYKINSRLFKAKDSGSISEVPVTELYPQLSSEVEINGLGKPLFSYFKPALSNSDKPFGRSVFADSIDTLKTLDVVFDSLCREFILGKKRIIVPVSAIKGEFDRKNGLRKYFDVNDEVYQAFSTNDRDELNITDNTQVLRVEEHLSAIDGLLDLLCLQTGMSPGTLSYHSETAKTAEEIMSRNDKTHRTKTAHQQLIREGLIDVIDNIILLGAKLGKIPASAVNEHAVIVFSDSISKDNSNKISNILALSNAEIIDKDEARKEIFGVTKSETEVI